MISCFRTDLNICSHLRMSMMVDISYLLSELGAHAAAEIRTANRFFFNHLQSAMKSGRQSRASQNQIPPRLLPGLCWKLSPASLHTTASGLQLILPKNRSLHHSRIPAGAWNHPWPVAFGVSKNVQHSANACFSGWDFQIRSNPLVRH